MNDDLKKRIGTAVVGVTLLLLMILFGGRIAVAIIALVISLGMLYEYLGFTLEMSDKSEKRWIMFTLTWLISFINFWISGVSFGLFLLSVFSLAIYFLAAIERLEPEHFKTHLREFVFCVFGFFYLVFIPFQLITIRETFEGAHWVILFLTITWSGDTGAYFAGRKYGKRKLYPKVSPKKTVEGLIGGIATAWFAALLYKLVFFSHLPWTGVLIIPPLIVFIGMLGDLFESFIKRAFDAKDSGSFLPGHGGFLDRFDSLLFGLPVMLACVKIFS